MSKTELAFEGTWKGMNQKIEVNIPLIIFQEDNVHIVYCPALELSGYGYSESEAKASFETALSEFLLYVTRKNTLATVLTGLGWRIKSKNKPMIPPSLDELSAGNESVKNILDNIPHQIFNRSVSLSATA